MAKRLLSYRELDVWKLGMASAKAVYALTALFPSSESFGLTSQMRRAAVSIPSNIAEGKARSTTSEFRRFLQVARGSLAEFETQLELSVELGYANRGESRALWKVLQELGAKRSTLITRLK